MTKKELPEIEMDYQEKILYMGLLNIQRMIIEIIPSDKYEEVFSKHTRKTITDISLLIKQRLDEITE